jgi:hypothetical protein
VYEVRATMKELGLTEQPGNKSRLFGNRWLMPALPAKAAK